jgi:hypothetical protein
MVKLREKRRKSMTKDVFAYVVWEETERCEPTFTACTASWWVRSTAARTA